MAIATIPGGLWLPGADFNGVGGAPTFTGSIIDAADEGLAAVFRFPKTGNVTKVLWATRTVTTGATITVRGETLDESATPSIPSGTLYHANFTGTTAVANGDDNVQILTTLAGSVPVTIGDKIAVVIKQPNTSFGNQQIATLGDSVTDFPYLLLNTGTSPAVSWAAVGTSPCIGLEYDDGSYSWVPGCYPFWAITTTAFGNGSTPDEIGLRFKVTFPCRVNSFWVWLDADGDFDVHLYDSDGASKLLTLSMDKDTRRTSAADIQKRRFSSTATLSANTYYRLVVEPTSATTLSIYDYTVNVAAVMDAFEGGQDFHLTSAKDPNEESDWTNTTTRRPFMGVGLDGFDDGTGSGGSALGLNYVIGG